MKLLWVLCHCELSSLTAVVGWKIMSPWNLSTKESRTILTDIQKSKAIKTWSIIDHPNIEKAPKTIVWWLEWILLLAFWTKSLHRKISSTALYCVVSRLERSAASCCRFRCRSDCSKWFIWDISGVLSKLNSYHFLHIDVFQTAVTKKDYLEHQYQSYSRINISHFCCAQIQQR